MNEIQESVLARIRSARMDADEKWGRSSGHLGPWIKNPYLGSTILSEETGEVARAALKKDRIGLEQELLDVAQVAVAWLESLEADRRAREEYISRKAQNIHTFDDCAVHGSCSETDICVNMCDCN